MSERGEYHPKHPKRIILDNYRGIASDMMQLDEPVADGFMRVSDMRYDVVVTQKPHERALDYDQLDTVRVAKILNLPRLEFWRKDGNLFIKREENTWFIAVDDQALSQEVIETNSGQRFDDAFVEKFQQTLRGGLKSCLRKEKLLNAGEYNRAFYHCYLGLLWDCDLAVVAGFIALGSHPVDGVLKVIAGDVLSHTVLNTFNLLTTRSSPAWTERKHGIFSIRNEPEFHEPFIRHSPFELPLPMVPLDRLIRGTYYLQQHGSKLIHKEKP